MAIILWILTGSACLALGACAVLNQPRFGKPPRGERLELVKRSPNYKNGEFQNQIPTPVFSQDVGMASVIWNNFFNKNDRLVPDKPTPAVKTDLNALDPR